MSICRGSIAPRIAFAFRMESFVCRRERTRYREPKSCPGDDPARQRRSELQAARGLRRSLRRSGGLQRLSLASAIILAAESFGLVPLLGVRRGCTGAHRSRSARSRLRPILQAGSLPAPPNLERRPSRAEARGIRSGDPRGSPRFAKKGPARGCSGTRLPCIRVCMKRPNSEPTVAILHKFGGQGSIARRRPRYANLRRRH